MSMKLYLTLIALTICSFLFGWFSHAAKFGSYLIVHPETYGTKSKAVYYKDSQGNRCVDAYVLESTACGSGGWDVQLEGVSTK